ncbi:hypothetical protein AC249_AIPGENE2231 [Exaiptasia diaphana]|nr:hypothetical protein AC249_AIPGENE2231 [Exaiptasia diaphana]
MDVQVASRPGSNSGFTLEPGDHVYTKNYSKYGPPNIPARVEKQTGPVSCTLATEQGQHLRRHFSQVFKQLPPESPFEKVGEDPEEPQSGAYPDLTSNEAPSIQKEEERKSTPPSPLALRRSGRERKPVDRLNL